MHEQSAIWPPRPAASLPPAVALPCLLCPSAPSKASWVQCWAVLFNLHLGRGLAGAPDAACQVPHSVHGGCDDGTAQRRVHFQIQRHVGHGLSIHHQPGACWEGAGGEGQVCHCAGHAAKDQEQRGHKVLRGGGGTVASGPSWNAPHPVLALHPSRHPGPPKRICNGRHTLPPAAPPVRPTHT